MLIELFILFISPLAFWKIKRIFPRWIGLDLYLICTLLATHFFGKNAGVLVGILSPLYWAFSKKDLSMIFVSVILGFSAWFYSVLFFSFITKGIIVALTYSVICYLFYSFLGKNSLIFSVTYLITNILQIVLAARWFL